MNSNKILLSSISPSVPIILASGSESRRVMLEDAGLDFKVFSSDVDEDILKQQMVGMPFEKQVVKLASAKAEEVSIKNQDHIVIGGDQMCVCNDKIFDKPGSVEKAINNLQVYLEQPIINIVVSVFLKTVNHYGSIMKLSK